MPKKTDKLEFGVNPQAIYNKEMEEALLGAILISPEALLEIADRRLIPTDFYVVKHQWVWEAYQTLADAHQHIDFLTVQTELERQQRFAEAGGLSFLTHLLNVVPTSLHVDTYAYNVRRDSLKRDLITCAQAKAKLAFSEEADINVLLAESAKIDSQINLRSMGNPVVTASEAASEYWDDYQESLTNPEKFQPLKTGFVNLDSIIGGLWKTDLHLIAARPGVGKTAKLLDIARNIVVNEPGRHIKIFSLEMGRTQLIQRLLAQFSLAMVPGPNGEETWSGLDTHALGLYRPVDGDIPVLINAIEQLAEKHIFIDDTPANNLAAIRASCLQHITQYGQLDLIEVDYLQLMRPDESRYENRALEVGQMAKGLHQLARELKVPVLAAVQMNRMIENRANKEPVLSDLKESGDLEQEGAIIIFMQKDPVYPNVMIDKVAKNRHGGLGEAELIWFPKQQGYRDAVARPIDPSQLGV